MLNHSFCWFPINQFLTKFITRWNFWQRSRWPRQMRWMVVAALINRNARSGWRSNGQRDVNMCQKSWYNSCNCSATISSINNIPSTTSKHQMSTHGSPKIKTPRSKPPKSNSKIQNPKIKTPKSKIKTPRSKIKTPRSKPPKSKLQDPNPQNQNSKIKTPFLVHDRSPPKNWQAFFWQIISTMRRISKWKSPKKSGNWFFPLNSMGLGKWMSKIRESFP